MSTGIGMGECCLSGKLNTTAKPTGKVEQIGGLPTYVASSPDGSKDKTIVVLTDIFGYELPNTRLLADNYAKAGFQVLVPDIQNGDPIDISFLDDAEPPLKVREGLSTVDKGVKGAKVAATLPPWLAKHREGVTKPIIDSFLEAVRGTPGVKKIGALGFCWGGRYAALCCGENAVDAGFAAHPSLIAVPGDFEGLKKPLAIAAGDKDSLLDISQVHQLKEFLDSKAAHVPTEVKIYEDQVHGFALRGDFSSEKDKKAMDDCEKQGIAWFKNHLS